MDMKTTAGLTNLNENVGFKCLHYSVSESAGFLEVTIVKKNPNIDIEFGVRTVDDTAAHNVNYEMF